MMGLNSSGRGRGHGNKTDFEGKGGHGGIMNQGPMLGPGPPGMPFSPVGFPQKPPFGSSPFLGGSPKYNFGPARHNKFNPRTFKKKFTSKSSGPSVPEIDLTKPWVTEEILNEDKIKLELLESWKKDKTHENWARYKAKKQIIQKIFEKAKSQYAASHPNEVVQWQSAPVIARHYYCEMCDKAFRTDDDLYLHEAEHETCGREGCDFTAHPKIISKHIKMQHETGLYTRIGKLYTDEDIAKWLEERKKRYPTRKVVEEKKILEQEKLNRGEKVKETNSIFNKSFNNKNKGRGRKKFEKKAYKNTKNQRTKKKKKVSLVQMSLEEEPSVRKGVPAFSGIKCNSEPVVPEKEDFDISDEEWKSEFKPPSPENPFINSALGLLAICYNSDEENRPKETQSEPRVKDLSADDGSDPEEVSSKVPLLEENSKDPKFPPKKNVSKKKDPRGRKRKNSSEDNNFPKRSLTLLEKLLKDEIRHERNVILQCVHYVVKNNFFKT